MAGNISGYNGSQNTNSSMKSFAITKSDTVDFAFLVRGIYVGTTGNVVWVAAYVLPATNVEKSIATPDVIRSRREPSCPRATQAY